MSLPLRPQKVQRTVKPAGSYQLQLEQLADAGSLRSAGSILLPLRFLERGAHTIPSQIGG